MNGIHTCMKIISTTITNTQNSDGAKWEKNWFQCEVIWYSAGNDCKEQNYKPITTSSKTICAGNIKITVME